MSGIFNNYNSYSSFYYTSNLYNEEQDLLNPPVPDDSHDNSFMYFDFPENDALNSYSNTELQSNEPNSSSSPESHLNDNNPHLALNPALHEINTPNNFATPAPTHIDSQSEKEIKQDELNQKIIQLNKEITNAEITLKIKK